MSRNAEIMIAERISRLTRRLEEVSTQPRALSSSFYQELFAIASRLRPILPADMASLQGHFEVALAVAIGNLEDLSALQDSVRELRCRPRSLTTKPQEYAAVQEALIRAIRGVVSMERRARSGLAMRNHVHRRAHVARRGGAHRPRRRADGTRSSRARPEFQMIAATTSA